MTVLGILIGDIIIAVVALVCGVLFNKPIRAALQKVPVVGRFF